MESHTDPKIASALNGIKWTLVAILVVLSLTFTPLLAVFAMSYVVYRLVPYGIRNSIDQLLAKIGRALIVTAVVTWGIICLFAPIALLIGALLLFGQWAPTAPKYAVYGVMAAGFAWLGWSCWKDNRKMKEEAAASSDDQSS